MRNRKSLHIAVAAIVTGFLVFTTAASKNQPGNKLEGAWVCTIRRPPPLQPVQWTMMLAPTDCSGRAAVGYGSVQVPVPPDLLCSATGQASPPAYVSAISRDYMGEAVMTGPRTARATCIGYSLNQEGQVAFLWMSAGELNFTARGKAKGTMTLAYYLPETDINYDGIPEGAPFCVLGPSEFDLTRVGLMPMPGLQ